MRPDLSRQLLRLSLWGLVHLQFRRIGGIDARYCLDQEQKQRSTVASSVNEYGTPLVSDLSIGEFELGHNEWVNLDTHYFEREESSSLWVWGCRPPGGEIERRATGESITEVLASYMNETHPPAVVGVLMNRSSSGSDGLGSLCVSDVLKKLGLYFLETKILNVVVDGASHAAPRFVRLGPTRDNKGEGVPAVFIPLIPESLFVENTEPLFANAAMTDWHQETDEWHLWEVLYKSGTNFLLFQSEFGYDDQVFVAQSDLVIPSELLVKARSISIPDNDPDKHPIDAWGSLLLLDRGRELLPE